MEDSVAAGHDSASSGDLGFGGGPPAVSGCIAPPAGGGATPPLQPLSGEDVNADDFRHCFDMVSGTVFSTKTCLELLPLLKPEQLDFEFNLFKANDPAFAESCASLVRSGSVTRSNASGSRTPGNSKMRELIRSSLLNTLCKNHESLIRNYTSLTNDFSFIATTLNEFRTRLEDPAPRPAATGKTATDDSSRSSLDSDIEDADLSDSADTDSLVSSPGNSIEPVRIWHDMSINADFGEVLQSIELNQRVGSRDTAFFGNVGYSYGKVNHKPKPFPRLPIFDMIFMTYHRKTHLSLVIISHAS
jgi:hypothetical protein